MPTKPTDVRATGTSLYYLPVQMRLPLKFGAETVTHGTCARVRMTVAGPAGSAEGWGETPLSAAWVWPSTLSFAEREEALKAFSVKLAEAWASFETSGHPIEITHAFIDSRLDALLGEFNRSRGQAEPMGHLAALVCCSAFDLALHDAYGKLHSRDIYDTYNAEYMNADLSAYLSGAEDGDVSFAGKYPADFLNYPRAGELAAWHLVGGKDLLDPTELTGDEPDDGYPVLLTDWIDRDGLKCLKIKLRGNDLAWDIDRMVRVGAIAAEGGALWLSADFNCMVTDPAYVNELLDHLLADHPRIYGMILYVEQPFPYDLRENRIDVHSVSARKPLFLDESAHDWTLVQLGRQLGWTGVALKTCKTQTGALLSLCWAKAHGMTLMVQDLTNPMLAQIPHCLLAAHAGTIMGIETNAMQFYPEASAAEAVVHGGLYSRRDGKVSLATVAGPGMGYRLDEIKRLLPDPVANFG